MCGLCGFGLTDAQMVLGLEEQKTHGMEVVMSPRHAIAAPSLSRKIETSQDRAERAAAKRSLHALIAHALTDVQHRRCSETEPAHGF